MALTAAVVAPKCKKAPKYKKRRMDDDDALNTDGGDFGDVDLGEGYTQNMFAKEKEAKEAEEANKAAEYEAHEREHYEYKVMAAARHV